MIRQSTVCLLKISLLTAMFFTKGTTAETEKLNSSVSKHPKIAALTSKHYIFASSSGTVDVAFVDVSHALCQSNLLGIVQSEYAAMLPANEKPEFTVEKLGDNQYFYKNKDGEESHLEEIFLGEADSGVILVAFYMKADRFFGECEALINVTVTEAENNACRYNAVVYAYPEGKVVRFLCRHLGVIERYFTKKTSDMTELVKKISLSLIEKME